MTERAIQPPAPVDLADMTPNQRARRDRVVHAVLEMVSEGRIDDLQMKDVAARSGVALGTIYRYFSSKDHLLAAALVEWGRHLEERTRHRSLPGGSPAEQVMAVVRRGVRAYEREPHTARLLLRVAGSSDPFAGECYRELSDSVMGAMGRALGHLPPDEAGAVQRIIGSVWFIGLFDWVNGRRSISKVYADLDDTARLLLTARR
jgi:TetR/AcrR family transcriptional regulator, cholesterol catabolism regulator